ncbi:hypothetical protein M404DRAFT_805227 [Pisolithus tinctorius Marx 270]|uniref:Uncharacterized protein n=1 Tax=Pisolithus tinctorius Marx 270 TaxID=870435 RepID=A0A0C3PS32_PISTI|nr:hypothetical protein M404DRAFT_805227 [Pisolithus tinctorius Marx 270]
MRDIHGLCDRYSHASDFPRTNCPYVCFVCSVCTIRFIVNRCFRMGYNVCKISTDTRFIQEPKKFDRAKGLFPPVVRNDAVLAIYPLTIIISSGSYTKKSLTTYRQPPSVVRDKARDNNLATR